MRITNTGNAPVKLLSQTASANFKVQSFCYNQISAGTSCQTSVQFIPSASLSGTITGKLTIVDNAPGSPHVVTLSGQAVAPSHALALSQTSVSFPQQAVGTAGVAQVIYLTNMNSSQVVINRIALSGVNASDFTEKQSCGGSLGFAVGARSTCQIMVQFAPGKSSLGVRTATVTVTPASGTPLTVQLTGTGVSAP